MSVYLDGPVPWLFDPESEALAALARDAEARLADTPCGDLREDAALLEQLLRERHFGVANGVVDVPRIELPAARTWGDLAGLQAELRTALGDNHVRFYGTRAEPRRVDGPAVERREVDGVLVLRVQRLFGTPDDDRALREWVAGADGDFAYDRVVIDLRGNTGGNDGFTYRWAERRLRGVEAFARDSSWHVGGTLLAFWNRGVWQRALHGTELPEPLAGELEVADETDDLPAGDRPWDGRMLVLVDRLTRSSGESSAWLLRQGLGARLLGEATFGMIEYGNVVPYVLPRTGLAISLPTKRNDYGFAVEGVGFPVDVPLDPATPVEDVARQFESFV